MASVGEGKLQHSITGGTLAIDLGSTTTVVAFTPSGERQADLLELPPISRRPGEIPSLIWMKPESTLIGKQVLEAGLIDKDDPCMFADFKRRIGSALDDGTAARAGQLLLEGIWAQLPESIEVQRLVLSAPVETYRDYRRWLMKACAALPVNEVALVDEPTAAALGAGFNPGAHILVVDLGGSTLDLALVALQGGEGRSAPVAQLLRLGGRELGDNSRQQLRHAEVLGKAGLRLGGRDIDHWILDCCCPTAPVGAAQLNAAERLKCRLSDPELPEQTELLEEVSDADATQLRLSRRGLENLLKERGLGKALEELLEETLTGGRRHGCDLTELDGVVAVGGGAQLPWLRRWLDEHTAPAPLVTPPPVEAVALGALSLTPGVSIRDVLQRGVSLRTWDQRTQKHCWHPLFMAGQPWPSPEPFELIMAASRDDQKQLELVLAEPQEQGRFSVIEVDGLPVLQQGSAGELEHRPWSGAPILLPLNPPAQAGEDCLRLRLRIDDAALLQAEITDLRSGETLTVKPLGSIR